MYTCMRDEHVHAAREHVCTPNFQPLSRLEPENGGGSNSSQEASCQYPPVVLKKTRLAEVLVVHGDADDAET